MLSLNKKGDLSIDQIIIMAILLILLIVLVIYMGVLRESSSNLLDKIFGVFTGS